MELGGSAKGKVKFPMVSIVIVQTIRS